MKTERRFLCLLTAFLLALIAIPAWADSANTIRLSDTTQPNDLTLTGSWVWEGFSENRSRRDRQDWIQIEEARTFGTYYYGGFSERAIIWKTRPEKQSEGAPLRFDFSGPAGELSFTGALVRKGAEGRFEFKGDRKFSEEAALLCGSKPDAEALFRLALRNASIDQLKEFKKTGLSLNVAEWLQLLNTGISPDYAAEMYKALGGASVDAIVQCRNSGLTAEYAAAFRKAGYQWDHRALIRVRNSGVPAEYAEELKKGGFDLSEDQIIRLRNSGVPTRFAVSVRELGFSKIDEIIRMRNNGLSENFLHEMREADSEYSMDQMIRLRNSGVPASYIKTAKKAGYKFTVDEIIRLRNSGVPESFLEEIQVPDRKPLSAETIINLRNRGVSAQTVRELRQ